jgi:MFS family permease
LLITGLIGMTVGLVAIAAAFAFLNKNPTTGGGTSVVGIVTLIAMIVYIASFAFSLGPVVWTMISEIFPSQVRGRAVAVSAAVNWGAAFIVSATFLSLIDAIGEVATFLLFAVMCVIALFWVKAKVPETKGKSLEAIQEAWAEHDAAKDAPPKADLAVDLP